ncbi:MAG: hypothetical protein QOJ76_3034, partial [Acidobacteriota bacterium]|nr:hypothetical protein [Acidobacteriota bacterium]
MNEKLYCLSFILHPFAFRLLVYRRRGEVAGVELDGLIGVRVGSAGLDAV